MSISSVLSKQFVLLGMSHVFDSGLNVPVERLEELVFTLDRLGRIKDALHSFMVCLFSVESKSLDFVLVLSIVKHSLWQYVLKINCVVEVIGLGPPSRVDLHGI